MNHHSLRCNYPYRPSQGQYLVLQASLWLAIVLQTLRSQNGSPTYDAWVDGPPAELHWPTCGVRLGRVYLTTGEPLVTSTGTFCGPSPSKPHPSGPLSESVQNSVSFIPTYQDWPILPYLYYATILLSTPSTGIILPETLTLTRTPASRNPVFEINAQIRHISYVLSTRYLWLS